MRKNMKKISIVLSILTKKYTEEKSGGFEYEF